MTKKKAPKRKPAALKVKKGGVDSYSIEHTVPTVQFGNVKYKAEGSDMNSVVVAALEMIDKYPPRDPLAEAQEDQFNQAAQEIRSQNEVEQTLPAVEPEVIPVDGQKAF